MACKCPGAKKSTTSICSEAKNANEQSKEFLCKCCNDKIKGKFGLAWVASFPNCPCSEPLGWQVEFSGTPAEVTARCKEIIEWVNAPPLPDNTTTELKTETEDASSPCTCCPQQYMHHNNYYNQPNQYDYYNDYYSKDVSSCSCKPKDVYCTRCKSCKVQPEMPYSLEQTPPDIIKLCPPKVQESPCTCNKGGTNYFMSVNNINCHPHCSQGNLHKCKSYPATKSPCINIGDVRKEAQDNGCRCNTIRSEAYVSQKQSMREMQVGNYALEERPSNPKLSIHGDYTSANDVDIGDTLKASNHCLCNDSKKSIRITNYGDCLEEKVVNVPKARKKNSQDQLCTKNKTLMERHSNYQRCPNENIGEWGQERNRKYAKKKRYYNVRKRKWLLVDVACYLSKRLTEFINYETEMLSCAPKKD